MPKMFGITVPYHGHIYLEIIAETEEQALDLVSNEIDTMTPDLDDPEFDDADAEIESDRDLTADEMKAWLIEQAAKLEATKPPVTESTETKPE